MQQFIQWLLTLITPRNRCAPFPAAQPPSERQALASGQSLPAPQLLPTIPHHPGGRGSRRAASGENLQSSDNRLHRHLTIDPPRPSERQALASGQSLPAPPYPLVDRPALKGPDNLAQGNALGHRTPIPPGPERASQTTEQGTRQLPF